MSHWGWAKPLSIVQNCWCKGTFLHEGLVTEPIKCPRWRPACSSQNFLNRNGCTFSLRSRSHSSAVGFKHRNIYACSFHGFVKCLMHSQQLPHVLCGAGALIKGCFAPVLIVKGRLHKALGPISAPQLCYMCMPMRPNKAETAVHGCHYLGQEPILPGWYGCAYARPWVGVWACHLLLLFEKSYLSCRLCQMCVNSHNKNRMTHPYG